MSRTARLSRRIARQRRIAALRRDAMELIATLPAVEPLPPEEREGQVQRMRAFERLPEAVRAAIRECPWDVHILRRLPSCMDCTDLITQIRAIKSEREAIAFNQQHMPPSRGFGRAW